eukprot:1601880-Pleurochrysis_carterae.AAC.9
MLKVIQRGGKQLAASSRSMARAIECTLQLCTASICVLPASKRRGRRRARYRTVRACAPKRPAPHSSGS